MAMKLSLEERRRVPRIPFETEMKYKILKGNMYDSEEYCGGKVKNISEYGMGIITDKELNEEDIIRINFLIGQKEYNIFCEVIWCKEISFSGNYEIGLEYSYINENDYNFLCSAVKTLRNMKKNN
jgi:hypothetical protein